MKFLALTLMALYVQESSQFLFLLGDLFKQKGLLGGNKSVSGQIGCCSGGGHAKGGFYVRKGYPGSRFIGPVIASGLSQEEAHTIASGGSINSQTTQTNFQSSFNSQSSFTQSGSKKGVDINVLKKKFNRNQNSQSIEENETNDIQVDGEINDDQSWEVQEQEGRNGVEQTSSIEQNSSSNGLNSFFNTISFNNPSNLKVKTNRRQESSTSNIQTIENFNEGTGESIQVNIPQGVKVVFNKKGRQFIQGTKKVKNIRDEVSINQESTSTSSNSSTISSNQINSLISALRSKQDLPQIFMNGQSIPFNTFIQVLQKSNLFLNQKISREQILDAASGKKNLVINAFDKKPIRVNNKRVNPGYFQDITTGSSQNGEETGNIIQIEQEDDQPNQE